MALSLVGVLSAGSAAALVNTQILDSGPNESGASKAVLPPAPTVELSVPDANRSGSLPTLSGPDGPPSTTTTTTMPIGVNPQLGAPAATSTTTRSGSGLLTSFDVGDAGVVTVDVVGGNLVLVAAEPEPGWNVTKAEDDSNDDSDEQENEVEVVFASASVRVEFEAVFIDGRIVPRVESSSIGTTANTVASTIAEHDHDDHDDDDDRSGSSHDDDDDDDDDHDDEDDDRDDDDRDDDDRDDERDDERDDD